MLDRKAKELTILHHDHTELDTETRKLQTATANDSRSGLVLVASLTLHWTARAVRIMLDVECFCAGIDTTSVPLSLFLSPCARLREKTPACGEATAPGKLLPLESSWNCSHYSLHGHMLTLHTFQYD